MSNFATGLFLGVDGLELGLCAGQLDLAGEGPVELGQLVEIFTDSTETLGFFDCGGDVSQLVTFAEDDLFGFVVEKPNKGLGPWFIDREVELELLLWSAISVPEDGDVGLEDPGRGLWGGLYGEGTLRRGGKAMEAEVGLEVCGVVC
jgi:hypothetical protein